MHTLFTALLVLLLAQSLSAATDQNDVDHIALATLMIYDGKFDQAQAELALVDQNAANFDAAKFYTTQGVLETKRDNHAGAIESYLKAIDATKTKVYVAPKIYVKREHLFTLGSDEKPVIQAPAFDPEAIRKESIEKLYIYLSQSYYKQKEWLNSVQALDLAGERGKDKASLFAFRADCYWKAIKREEAIAALDEGFKRFDDASLLKQKFYYFAELGLYQAAIDASKAYMKRSGASEEDYAALAQMLLSANQTAEAIKVLEESKLHFAHQSRFALLLGHAYLKTGKPYTGAAQMEHASHFDPAHLKDAVELYRRVKNYPHAIYLNTLQSDNAEKLKQNIAIFIEREEFEKVIGLRDALGRYGMLQDDNIRYALAYAYYMAHDFDAAEAELKKITDSELFAKATVIRKNIELCKDDSMECI